MLVAALCSGLAWILVPIKYETSAMLQVAETNPKIFGSGRTDDFGTYKRAQVQLIKDPFVLKAALLDPEISQLSLIREHSEDPEVWLASQLIIDYPGDATLLRIAMRGERRTELPKIVNAVKDAYLNEGLNRERSIRAKERDSLEQSLQDNQNRVREIRLSIHEMSKKLGLTSSDDVNWKKTAKLDQFTTLLQQRAATVNDIREMKLTLKMLEHAGKSQDAKADDQYVEMEISQDQQIARLEDDLARMKQLEFEESLRAAKPNAPSVVDLRQKVAKLEEAIEDRKAQLRPVIYEKVKLGNNNKSKIEFAKLKLEELETTLKEDSDSIKAIVGDVEAIDKYSGELIAQQNELDALLQVTTQMDQELRVWEINKFATPRILEVRAATVPSGNDALTKHMSVAFAGLVGFMAVLFGVAYIEFQSRRLNSRRDVNEGLGLRVLGALPSFSGRAWRRSSTRGMVQATLAESIDSIRTSLIHASSASPIRVVMISSAEPREGKTTVASQLAGSLARAGRKTLYIDGDLRNAAAHRVFELPQEPGLCEMLRGEVEREAVLQPTRAANLWLLPAGRCDARSVQALPTAALGDAIAALRNQFDFIIIDSGPVLTVADPLLLGQHVDAAILSVLRDISKVPHIYEATERLRSVGINLMGVVVNGVTDRTSRSGYELQLAESA